MTTNNRKIEGTYEYKMNQEEEDAVRSLGSVPDLTIQLEVRDSDEPSGEPRSGADVCVSGNKKGVWACKYDEGRAAKWEGLNPIMDR